MSTAEQDWPAHVSAVIAREVRRLRRARGLTVAELAERLGVLGAPLAPAVLNKLEQRKRETVSVAELLALGAALRVPPLSLLFPLDVSDDVKPLPEVDASPWHATLWAIGEKSETHTPLYDLYGKGRSLVKLFRDHDSELSALFTLRNMVIENQEELAAIRAGVAVGRVPVDLDVDARVAVDVAFDNADRVGQEVNPTEDDLRETLRVTEARAVRVRQRVVQLRRLIREQDATPPASRTSTLLGPWPDEDDDRGKGTK